MSVYSSRRGDGHIALRQYRGIAVTSFVGRLRASLAGFCSVRDSDHLSVCPAGDPTNQPTNRQWHWPEAIDLADKCGH